MSQHVSVIEEYSLFDRKINISSTAIVGEHARPIKGGIWLFWMLVISLVGVCEFEAF